MAVLDTGPYFHGTRADLQVGDLLTAGFRSNYDGRVVLGFFWGASKFRGFASRNTAFVGGRRGKNLGLP